jgi:hypothetical protein
MKLKVILFVVISYSSPKSFVRTLLIQLLPYSFFLLPYSFFLIPSSLFLLPYSLFLIPSSFFLIPSSFFLLPSSLFLLPSSLFLIPSSLFLLKIADVHKSNKIALLAFKRFLFLDYQSNQFLYRSSQ